jgi:FKBP-type peptidyl-prolyl cis-trans isomerase
MTEVANGFADNLNANKPSDCEATLMKLFGPNFQDFDSTYAKEGAACLGKLTANAFYTDMVKMKGLDLIDLKMTVTGFRHGLLKKDTIVSDEQKQAMIQRFIQSLNVKNGKKMMEDAAKIKGAQVFENGIVMEVITEGKGGSPAATDDVKVEYILTSATGDTVQSSYDMKKQKGTMEPVALKLNGGVIPGWSYVVPKMKKGGKYRVYIPWNLLHCIMAGVPVASSTYTASAVRDHHSYGYFSNNQITELKQTKAYTHAHGYLQYGRIGTSQKCRRCTSERPQRLFRSRCSGRGVSCACRRPTTRAEWPLRSCTPWRDVIHVFFNRCSCLVSVWCPTVTPPPR